MNITVPKSVPVPWPDPHQQLVFEDNVVLCPACQELASRIPGVFQNPWEEEWDVLTHDRRDVFPALPSLTLSSAEGCQFCACLLTAIRARCPFAEDKENTILFSRFTCDASFDDLTHRHLQILVESETTDQVFQLIFLILYNHRLTTDIASDVNMQVVTVQLEHCSEQHDECRVGSDWLPTRLLDLDPGWNGADICLIESAKLRGPQSAHRYAALSYCWGDAKLYPPLRTTTATLQKRFEGIGVDEMPATIWDAVQVTRRLGMRYLWIDALCIIQEDSADWEKESATMAQVYGRAYITIAAVRAPHSHAGFLDSPPGSRGVDVIPLIEGRPATELAIIVVPIGDFDWGQEDISNSVWNSRAWTFQEHRISRRVLYFGQFLYFECNRHHINEVARVCHSGMSFKRTFPNRQRRATAKLSVNGTFFDWRQAIAEYSGRQLTNVQDRLPALSALAHHLTMTTPLTDVTYLAGLWKEDLYNELLWHVNRNNLESEVAALAPGHEVVNSSSTDTVSPYIAPSWSWAAILRPVQTARIFDSVQVVQILDVKTESTGIDKMGQVEAGYLHLSGYMKCLQPSNLDEADREFWEQCDGDQPPITPSDQICAVLFGFGRISSKVTVEPATRKKLMESQTFDSHAIGDLRVYIEGLVLKKTSQAIDGRDAFVRIGTFSIDAPSTSPMRTSFDGCSRVELMVV